MGKDAQLRATRRLLKSPDGDDVVIRSGHTSGHAIDRDQERWVQELLAAHVRPWGELAFLQAQELGRGGLVVGFRTPGTLDTIEPDLRQDPRHPDSFTLLYLPEAGFRKLLGSNVPEGWQSALDRVARYDPDSEVVMVVDALRTVYSATLTPGEPISGPSPN